jgi:hypothetical protein
MSTNWTASEEDAVGILKMINSYMSEPIKEDAVGVLNLVNTYTSQLIKKLGISRWKISVIFRKLEDFEGQRVKAEALIDSLASFERASILVNPEWVLTAPDEEIRDTLLHELLHIIAAPMTLYSRMVTAIVPKGAAAIEAEAHRHFSEQLVLNLERMIRSIDEDGKSNQSES